MISDNNYLFDAFFPGEDRAVFTGLPYRPGDVGLGYVICILPRCGSTFLAYLLKENRYYGMPHEWFNKETFDDIIKEGLAGSLDEYLSFLWKTYSSETGIFGMQVSYPQLTFLQEVAPIENVLGENIRWFYLVRENIVAQAVSLYIAKQSGYFHSFMEKPAGMDVAYDPQPIKDDIDMLIDQEAAFETLFSARSNCPVRLSYESMLKDTRSTVALFRNVLGGRAGQGDCRHRCHQAGWRRA